MIIPINKIKKPKYYINQNTKLFKQMVESIINEGVIVPIVVRACKRKYEIIDGRCRFYAAQSAGLKEIPVTIIP